MQIFKKKGFLKIWCILVLTIISFFVGAMGCSFLCDRLLNHGFLYSYEDKLAALKKEKNSKIVFLGGSSVLFGVNAEHYSSISGQPALNMGLNAGTGVYDLYLATATPFLQAGDTVVLAFEYDAYTQNWVGFTNVTLDLANSAPSYARTLSFEDKIDYLFQKSLRSYNKTFDVVYNILAEKLDTTPNIYLRKNINEFGDFDLAYTKDSTVKNPVNYSNGFQIKNESILEMKSYIEALENKDIAVYVAYPPAYLEASEEELLKLDKKLRENFGERVIGNIKDWTFQTGEKFFDTGYHLNSVATIEHTEYYYNLISQVEAGE